MTLGRAIRRARKAAGLTLREVANRMGSSVPFLSDIEHDRRHASNLGALADAIAVDPAELELHTSHLAADMREWLEDRPEEIAAIRRRMQAEGRGEPR